ncbi:uncharacterized protein LOC135095612 isoform X1 [Scylla paramamosain]|uniref:uncharacterized protein LOC135095612 isoform X1 n=1 Tax=Scylla paramamosain TaxID=85552 RepID=UPI00308382A6
MVVRDAGVAAGGAGLLHLSCAASYRQLLLSLIYVILLLVVVAAMAVKCRSIRENYREAAYIGAALCLVLPLWLAWCLAGLVLPSSLQPACLGFGVVATATIVFVVMFVPKGRQLAAMGKEGVYEEDQEDHLSTISGGARYSPSFFHFKPVKTPKDFLQPTSVYKTRLHAPTIPECLLPSLPPPSHSPSPSSSPPPPLTSPTSTTTTTTASLPHPFICIGHLHLHHHHHHYHHYYHYHPHHYYYQHQWYAGADRGCGGVAEEGVYSTIDTPAQHSQQYTPASTNPNFYLFRSHAHAGMMY